MKNLALGIYKYSTPFGDAYGWKLVELKDHTDKHCEDTQPVRELAGAKGFSTRETALDGYNYMCSWLGRTSGGPACVRIVDTPQYGWEQRKPSEQ